jgi:hypothetical protein
MIEHLPLETQTLYAELLEHLLAVHARRSFGRLRGTFTEKTVKGELYLYFQASQPGGSTKQFYVGRKTSRLERLVRDMERDRVAVAPDLERVRRLAAQLRAGGALTTDASSARVIHGLADAGVFAAGGVLVGTYAFAALANALGVRWSTGALRTQDDDVARRAEGDIDVAVPDVEVDLPSVLDSLKMGFLPVPPLDPRHPSTSFKVRGKALRVDLLSPQRGDNTDPVFLPRFNAAAQPLAHLGYLLDSPERAVVLNGGAVLVNVPAPARFAFHKLLIAPLRPAAMEAKSHKDIAQAKDLLEVLIEERPGDLTLAWEGLRGSGSRSAAQKGLARLASRHARIHRELQKVLRG